MSIRLIVGLPIDLNSTDSSLSTFSLFSSLFVSFLLVSNLRPLSVSLTFPILPFFTFCSLFSTPNIPLNYNSMAKLCRLPSILIESTNEDATALPADPPKPHWVRQLWRGFWRLLSLVHLYWNLLSHIPLDLYLFTIFTNRAEPEKSISIDDRLDLHSTLPLLIVSAKNSPEICFYNTETSECIWTFRIRMPRDTRNGQAIVKPSITCLKFSPGNHLAVGLSDGTVHFIEQDFATMIKFPPTPKTAQQPNSERVKLLPLSGSRVNADVAGNVTNLVFSPSISGMTGDGVWLAIATEKAGVWIWSQRTNEAIRAVSTAGINEGCLHWVSADFPIDLQRSALPHAYNSQPIGSSIGVFGGPSREADKDTHFGKSFLIFGTKTGKLQIQRLWHSCRTMVRETSIELSPTAFVQSQSWLTHRFGPASGEITHLVIQSNNITTSETKLTIFMTSENDADSSIPVHQFSISLPFKEPLETWCGRVPALAAGILRSLVNLFLARTNYQCLSRRKWPSEADHLVVQNDGPQASSASADIRQNRALTSASALSTTPLLLTTTHVKRSHRSNYVPKGECILRSYHASISSLATNLAIRPLLPTPDDIPPLSPSPQEAPRPGCNYYTTMMAQAGITKSTTQTRRRSNGGHVATHAYDCGRVAWGQQNGGEAIGAFLYKPASLLDSSLAVGLFQVQY